ncbi:hypothetical protein HDC92_001827 [Pedobacter sp. AK017]|uniref:hypothetical protein n=1 Tax=Pedobacter sp. AK017 TaxID=2723073 RepID=UPI001618723F|nr:hypothetical protein [Pedobacter sp. AK017]MBB5438152.1 hypothetical protein [Pedobacter sp. AK017]
MNTLKIVKDEVSERNLFANRFIKTSGRSYVGYVLLGLLLLWPLLQHWLMRSDPTVGYVDPNIWLLVLLSLICFLIVTGLCWWLLQRFWMSLGLPTLGNMVVQFKKMESWRQLGFYFASFCLLLLAAVGCLSAIC